jgi:hypothetical protein
VGSEICGASKLEKLLHICMKVVKSESQSMERVFQW